MMGTTANYGLPYPEGTDLVVAGDDAIQALAEAVAARLLAINTRSYVITNSGPAQGIGTTEALVHFDEGSHSADWTNPAAGLFQYFGDPRWFLISAVVSFQSESYMSSTVRLYEQGGDYHGTSIFLGPAAVADPGLVQTHSIVSPVLLGAGSVIGVPATTSATIPGDGVIVNRSLRMVSLPS